MATVIFTNGVLYINDEPVIHEGSEGFGEMQQLCWVRVGDQRIIQPVTTRVYAKDLENLSNVTVDGYRVATIKSYFKKSYGDEHTEGGVKSGTKGGPAYFTTASPNVSVKGNHIVRRGDLIIANNGNSEPGAWQENLPAAPAFAQKLISTPLHSNALPKKININILMSPHHEQTDLPFQRALLATPDEQKKYYREALGGTKNKNTITYDIDVDNSSLFTIKECLNDPLEGLLEIELGKASPSHEITLLATDLKLLHSHDNDIRHIGPLHRYTWLYLFKDNYLWREFQYLQLHRNVCEINLKQHEGKDERSSSARIHRGILLTLSDSEGEHEYHYVVSPVQWTWKEIEKMGGILPGEKSTSVTARQEKRLYKLNLKSLMSANTVTPDYQCSGNIAWMRYEEEALAAHMHPKDILYRYPHPALAVIYVRDPLNNALNLAKNITERFNTHLAFLAKNEDLYHAAKLVGDVLTSFDKQGEDYRKHVRDEGRLRHIPMYEKTVKEYTEFMEKSVPGLIEYIKQAKEKHAWDHFLMDDSNASEEASDLLKKEAHYWMTIGFALNQSDAGQDFLGQLLMDDTSPLQRTLARLEKYVLDRSLRDIVIGLSEVCGTAAARFEGGMKKIVDWLQSFVSDLGKIELMEVPLSMILAPQRAKHEPLLLEPHSSVYGPTGEELLYHSKEEREIFEPRSMYDSAVDKIHYRERTAVNVKVIAWAGEMLQQTRVESKLGVAVKGENGVGVKVGTAADGKISNLAEIDKERMPNVIRLFTALSALNTVQIYQEIKRRKPELLSTEQGWIYAEFIGALSETLYFATRFTGHTLYQACRLEWKSKGLFIHYMSLVGLSAGLIVDGAKMSQALQSGATGLLVGHGFNFTAGLIELALLFSDFKFFRTLLSFAPISLTIPAFVCLVIGTLVVWYFTKNEWEEWLFQSPWGTADNHETTYTKTIQKLLDILTLIYVADISYQDLSLNEKVAEWARISADSPSELISITHPTHEILIHSPIHLTFYIQKMEDTHIVTQLFKIHRENKKITAIERWHYQQYNESKEGIHVMRLGLPAKILANTWEKLIFSIKYYTMKEGYTTLLESKNYRIEYDFAYYQYKATLVDEYKPYGGIHEDQQSNP